MSKLFLFCILMPVLSLELTDDKLNSYGRKMVEEVNQRESSVVTSTSPRNMNLVPRLALPLPQRRLPTEKRKKLFEMLTLKPLAHWRPLSSAAHLGGLQISSATMKVSSSARASSSKDSWHKSSEDDAESEEL
jgi:hypothetical protein